MARKKRRGDFRAGELNLVAMIDVAFQLLSFFLVTVHPVTVLTNLDVSRPQAEKPVEQESKIDDLLKVTVYKGGFSMNGRKYTLPNLDKELGKVADISKKTTVILISTDDAFHEDLVRVLDILYKNKLHNIFLMSI